MRATQMIVKVLLFLVIVMAGFGSAVLYLWNWLMPALFKLPIITYWQAVGLLGLSWVLFGGWRGFRGPGGPGGRWRRRLQERWENMTPEEREKLKQGLRRGCGPFPPGAEAKP